MGFANYISESEATNLCGVSAKTLTRFVEAGHLSVEHETDGLKLYCAEELQKIFGSSMKTRPSVKHRATETAKSSTAKSNTAKSKNGLSDQHSVGGHSEDRKPKSSDKNENASSYYSASVPTEFARVLEGANTQITQNGLKEDVAFHPVSEPQAANPSPPLSPLLEMEQKEVARLRSLVEKLERINEVNEKIIDLREDHISQITEERDWLRARVEKLEEKADRDQVLLLTETQLLRQMIEQKQLERSPVRAALEWFGLVESKRPTRIPTGQVVVE